MVLLAGTGVTVVLSLAYSVYAQRTLGPMQAADFVAALSLVAFGQIALGPINGTVTRFTAQFASHGQYGKVRALCRKITRRVALYMLVGVVVALIFVERLANLLQFQSLTPLLVAYGMIYVTLILSVSRGVLRGLQAFGQLNVNVILEAAVRLAVGIALLGFLCTAGTGLSAYLAALILTLAVSYRQINRAWTGHDRPGSLSHSHGRSHTPVENRCHTEDTCHTESVDARAVIRFARPMFLMMIISAGFQNIDMLMVKHYFVGTDAGVYGAAFVLARSMGALVTPFTTLMLPLMTTMHERGDRTAGTFVRVSGYFLALATIPVALFWLWPDEIIDALYGSQFAGAASVLLVLTLARLLGYLIHMIALAGAARNSFRFLYVYALGLVAQTAALCVWHESPVQIAVVMLVGQALTLAPMAGAVLWGTATSERTHSKAAPSQSPCPTDLRAGGVRPLVSVVIPTYNRCGVLSRCLEALAGQTYDHYEVIVVDDGSSDGTSDVLAGFAYDHPDIAFRWVCNESQVGANPSRNRGIRESRGEFVAFADNDCIAAADWLERLMSGFNSENVAAVTGRVDDPKPSNVYELTLKGTHRVYGRGRVHATRLVAGNMCVRRDLLVKYPFDEDRAKLCSDVEVSGRGDEEGLYLMLRAAGYEQHVVHDAVVIHEHGCSRRTFFGQAYRSGGSAARLAYKYGLPPRVELVPLLLAYLLLPLAGLGPLAWLPSALAAGLFLSAIAYNDLFRKGKNVWETLITFPLLLAYYHTRLAGYLVQYARLWTGLDSLQRVRPLAARITSERPKTGHQESHRR